MNSFYFLLSLMILDCCLAENEYYTYDRIDSTLHAWQDTFGYTPHSSNYYSNYNFGIIYNLDTIGYSSQDSLPIYAVKLSSHADKREAEPRVLILGQCHAEEIYGVEIAMEIINQFLHPDQYTINRPHMQIGLKFTELWIIPTLNPEGLRVVHGYFENGIEIKDVTYRKNKWDTNNNGIFDYIPGVGQDIDGVDLNRNYNFNWIFGDTLLQPGASCNQGYFDDYDYYRGLYPESESEIQAIMDWTIKQQFLLSIAYHSSRSGCIDRYVIYPWAWNDKWEEDVREYSPGFNVIEKLGVEIAEIAGMDRGSNYGHTGTSYRKGNAQDWLYRETGCIQYLVEVGYTPDHQYDGGLLVEEDHLEEVIESNLNAFFHLLMRAAGGRSYTNVLGESADGNQVTGIVSDAITGIPIEGAYVRIDELEEGNILRPRKTDSLGYFCRLLYPNETYTLVVSAHGYTTSDTINIIHSTSGPTTVNIELSPSPIHELTFNMQLPNNDNTDMQLIIKNLFKSDTVNIIHGESINLPQDQYRLIISSSDYIPQVFDIDLIENMELSVNFLYEEVIWNSSGNNGELMIPLSSLMAGDSLIIELNFRYELEWDYDYFSIQYTNGDNATDIIKYTGDNFQNHTEYIPFTIPEGHSNESLYLHRVQDETDKLEKYRGVYVEYINILKGSETLDKIDHVSDVLPDKFHLQQNYPNPFNPTTNIKFSVPILAPISISIYNIKGELVERLINGVYGPGNYEVSLSAKQYASGVYIYRLESEDTHYTKKLMVIK